MLVVRGGEVWLDLPNEGREPNMRRPPVGVRGGRVMKKLRNIMRSGFLFTVQKQATVSEAVRLMADHNVGIVIVIDRDRLVGVFSERDVVRRVLRQGLDPATLPVSEVMTPHVVTADAEMDYESAMTAMA